MERCLASAAAGVKVLERCLACEADFERVAPNTSALADKCEPDLKRVAEARPTGNG